MKKTLLATAAAIALIAGPAFAQTQNAPAEKAEAPARAPAAQQNAPAEKVAPGMKAGARSDTKAGGSKAEGRAGAKSETTGQAGQDGQKQPRAAQPSRAQGSEGKAPKAAASGDKAPDGRQGAQSSQDGASATERSNVTLTADQKTKIRTTIIQSKSAPRVANVNFALNVGTVVPRTVNIVSVPSTLIEIYPAWRGYRYFIVGERLVIVEPNSLRIVAVLVV